MPYSKLLRDGRIRRHTTNPQEIASLFAIAERDLADASLAALSADRRFATAYNAVLQSATAILYAAGYRPHGVGHHSTTFDALLIALGPTHASLVDYFQDCRRKRNIADYSQVGSVSQTEAEALLSEARAFIEQARAWIKQHYPQLAA